MLNPFNYDRFDVYAKFVTGYFEHSDFTFKDTPYFTDLPIEIAIDQSTSSVGILVAHAETKQWLMLIQVNNLYLPKEEFQEMLRQFLIEISKGAKVTLFIPEKIVLGRGIKSFQTLAELMGVLKLLPMQAQSFEHAKIDAIDSGVWRKHFMGKESKGRKRQEKKDCLMNFLRKNYDDIFSDFYPYWGKDADVGEVFGIYQGYLRRGTQTIENLEIPKVYRSLKARSKCGHRVFYVPLYEIPDCLTPLHPLFESATLVVTELDVLSTVPRVPSLNLGSCYFLADESEEPWLAWEIGVKLKEENVFVVLVG